MAARATTLFPGLAAPKLSDDFLTTARSLPLSYTDFSLSVVPRSPFPCSTAYHCSIFERIAHPYHPDAFDVLLRKHGLSSAYPLLTNNLRHGFPLGHMPALTESVILPNNPSTYPYMHEIQDYLRKELLAGRMSGPFSREETELILRGPFFSSPLIVDVQPQQPGTPDKIRICRHLSKGSKLHPSVNSHIRKEDFPTRFDLASKVAEIVSYPFQFLFPSHFLHVFLYIPLRFVRGLFSFSAATCSLRYLHGSCVISDPLPVSLAQLALLSFVAMHILCLFDALRTSLSLVFLLRNLRLPFFGGQGHLVFVLLFLLRALLMLVLHFSLLS